MSLIMYKYVERFESTIKAVASKITTGVYKNLIDSVWIFGSYVKNDVGTDSDLDIYIVFQDSELSTNEQHRCAHMYCNSIYDPESMLVETDVHYCSKEEWEANANDLILQIKEHGVKIIEKGVYCYEDLYRLSNDKRFIILQR